MPRWQLRARERLGTRKDPRGVEFRDSLPLTSTGKILKRELTAKAGGRSGHGAQEHALGRLHKLRRR